MIIYTPHNEVRTWYVVFDQPRSERWRLFHPLTGRRFAHCWAFTEVPGGVMRVEMLDWGLCVTHEQAELLPMLAALCESTTAVLSVTVDYNIAAAYPSPRGLITCVSALKALLALRGCTFTLTPFQLYKRLCRHSGCVPIKPWSPYVREVNGAGSQKHFQPPEAA